MLIVLPLGLLSIGVLFDVLYLVTGTAEFAEGLPLVLGLAGVGLALVTAWLGGELVYRLRVGVDDDAGLNASNALRREGIASTPRTSSTSRSAG